MKNQATVTANTDFDRNFIQTASLWTPLLNCCQWVPAVENALGYVEGRFTAVIIALVVQAAVLPGESHAQSPVTNWNPGLAVGNQAPAFKLVGQDGKEHDLAELLVKGKLALVFQRSADW